MAEILFLAHRIPFPPDKGDKIRAYHVLSHLARSHVVHLGCLIDDVGDWRHVDQLRRLCHECHFAALPRARRRLRAAGALARNQAITVAALRDPALAGWIADLLRRRPIDGVFAYSSGMAQYLAAVPATVPRIVDFVDADSEKWRQLAAGRRWPWSWLYRRESERLRAFDHDATDRCDRCLFVSSAEARSFEELVASARAKTLVIPNGVDGGCFAPEVGHPCPFPQGGPVLAFTGDMSYWPNEDAVLWFAREVLPELRTNRPDLRFVVVGRGPGRRLCRAAARLGMDLSGTVPDVRPFLAHAALGVAPLRVARGVPNKVLEAMAMAKAVVATPAAITGLRLRPGRDILIAETPAAFAEAVISLLDPHRAAALGARARARVVADYAWAASLRRLDCLIAGPSSRARA
ncbi:MAG: TIGR03087 family PEP-CTERM/XrtA system glycosyltransferase [Geminicoccaceae bacterium]